MKNMIILAGLLLMLAVASAQDSASEAREKGAEKTEINPGKEMLTKPNYMSNEEIIENKSKLYMVRLQGRLKLSDEQVEAIRPIALERMKLMDKMVKEKEKGQPSRKFMLDIRRESKGLLDRINFLLSKEQQAEFLKMQKENLKKIREEKK